MKKSICFDFDGVIHAYREGWRDGSIYDQPVPGVLDCIRGLMAQWQPVVICSCRNPARIREWMGIHAPDITTISLMSDSRLGDWDNEPLFWRNHKVVLVTRLKPCSSIYIDDNALEFTDNDGEFLAARLRFRLRADPHKTL